MTPKKISVVIPSFYPGGMEKVRLVLIDEFLRRGYQVDIVVLKNWGSLKFSVPGSVTVRCLESKKIKSSMLPLLKYFRKEAPDAVLVAQWPLTWVAIVAMILSRCKASIVVSEHIFLEASSSVKPIHRLAFKLFGKFLYSRASSVVAVSTGVAASIRNLVGDPKLKVNVIFNPVRKSADCKALTSKDLSIMDWWTGGEKKILAVGRLVDQKNYPLLIKAFYYILREFNAKLLILGEGPNRTNLEANVKHYGLEEVVNLPGHVSSVDKFYEMADVFVLCSNYEGLPNVIIEALNHRCNIVSTDCPSGPRELLKNGQYGVLTSVGSVSELTSGLRDVFNRQEPSPPSIDDDWMVQFSPASAADKYLKAMFDQAG